MSSVHAGCRKRGLSVADAAQVSTDVGPRVLPALQAFSTTVSIACSRAGARCRTSLLPDPSTPDVHPLADAAEYLGAQEYTTATRDRIEHTNPLEHTV